MKECAQPGIIDTGGLRLYIQKRLKETSVYLAALALRSKFFSLQFFGETEGDGFLSRIAEHRSANTQYDPTRNDLNRSTMSGFLWFSIEEFRLPLSPRGVHRADIRTGTYLSARTVEADMVERLAK